jgi:hypothetical protein
MSSKVGTNEIAHIKVTFDCQVYDDAYDIVLYPNGMVQIRWDNAVMEGKGSVLSELQSESGCYFVVTAITRAGERASQVLQGPDLPPSLVKERAVDAARIMDLVSDPSGPPKVSSWSDLDGLPPVKPRASPEEAKVPNEEIPHSDLAQFKQVHSSAMTGAPVQLKTQLPGGFPTVFNLMTDEEGKPGAFNAHWGLHLRFNNEIKSKKRRKRWMKSISDGHDVGGSYAPFNTGLTNPPD